MIYVFAFCTDCFLNQIAMTFYHKKADKCAPLIMGQRNRKNRSPLQWRHNYQLHKCLLNRLFGNIKAPRHWPLWGEFTGRCIPRTKACNSENVSIWWHHHEVRQPQTVYQPDYMGIVYLGYLPIYANSIIISKRNVLTWRHHYTTHCSITCVISYVVIFSCLLLFPILKPPNVLLKGLRLTDECTRGTCEQ